MTFRHLLPLALLGWLSVPGFGQAPVTGRVAATLLELEHTCTPAQRLMLESLIRSGEASRAGRTVASAVLRILHTPHPDDVPKLRRIVADQRLPADVRSLAAIVQRFVHVASGADRIALQRIAYTAVGSRDEVLGVADRQRLMADRPMLTATGVWGSDFGHSGALSRVLGG